MGQPARNRRNNQAHTTGTAELRLTAHLVNTIKHQLLLKDQLPKSVSPVPTIIPDRLVCVNLDKNVCDDECPSEYPTRDDGENGFIVREVQLGAGEQGIGEEIAKRRKVCQSSNTFRFHSSGQDLLEQDDINDLSEHQPSVKLFRNLIPSVTFMPHLSLQLLLPPIRPRILDPTINTFLVGPLKPSQLAQLLHNPLFLALFPQYPSETCIIRSAPECKVQEKEG